MCREALIKAYKVTAEIGVPLSLALALFELEQGPRSTVQMADALELLPSGVRANLIRWRDKGLVESEMLPSTACGRRPFQWVLTPLGRKQLEAIRRKDIIRNCRCQTCSERSA